jgi:hypothetical protein
LRQAARKGKSGFAIRKKNENGGKKKVGRLAIFTTSPGAILRKWKCD